MIRYHSAYPVHRENAYAHLMNEADERRMERVRAFNPFDLYSKGHEPPDVDKLRPFYEDLISEFFPRTRVVTQADVPRRFPVWCREWYRLPIARLASFYFGGLESDLVDLKLERARPAPPPKKIPSEAVPSRSSKSFHANRNCFHSPLSGTSRCPARKPRVWLNTITEAPTTVAFGKERDP